MVWISFWNVTSNLKHEQLNSTEQLFPSFPQAPVNHLEKFFLKWCNINLTDVTFRIKSRNLFQNWVSRLGDQNALLNAGSSLPHIKSSPWWQSYWNSRPWRVHAAEFDSAEHFIFNLPKTSRLSTSVKESCLRSFWECINIRFIKSSDIGIHLGTTIFFCQFLSA